MRAQHVVRVAVLLGALLVPLRGAAAESGGGEVVAMPDGTNFVFWEDGTAYTRGYHVAREQAGASDENPGTAEKPFATIGRAAAVLMPGEKVVVHGGVYRECVRPARGGEGPDAMIAYEAAPGERVRITGSEILSDGIRGSEGWGPAASGAPVVWMADLPPNWFAQTGYNPFIANNMSAEYTTFTKDWTPEETRRQQLRRGLVFADGVPLQQVFRYGEVAASNGTFWVEEPGTRIHFRLPGDADPAGAVIECTAREQVFAPAVRGLGYIRVSGFTLDHAADGVPIPQRALLSTMRGHHWILENNTVRWANACGIDIGGESWHAWSGAASASARGGHIVRGNRISHCGICGIAGVGQLDDSRIEYNGIEHIGWQNVERMWETGGMKFHVCNRVLIRGNVIRHVRHAPGLWLDYRNQNTRVTGNLFQDIASRNGGLYLEVSHGPNVIDHNVFWGIYADRPASEKAHALNVDTGEKCTAAHNLFVDVPDGYAVAMHLGQAAREVGGRNGLCRKHAVLNNVFVRCRQRVLLERAEDNRCDGNLYDPGGDSMCYRIDYPSPRAIVNFGAWQEYFGYDLNGLQSPARVTLDDETGVLTLDVEGALPACEPVPILGGARDPVQPGPFAFEREATRWRAQDGSAQPRPPLDGP